MSELLRDEAKRVIGYTLDYIAEAERRGVPHDVSDKLREALVRLLDEAYDHVRG